MNLGMLSQSNFSLASIYTPQSMEIQRVSVQQVSPCVILVKGTDAVTWNKLRDIISKQDKLYVRKQLKGGGSGWLVKIEIQKRLMAEITQLKMVYDAIPLFVKEIQLPFSFQNYMEGLVGDRKYHVTGEINTAETIRICRNSWIKGNSSFTENQKQSQGKQIIRTLEKLPGEVMEKLFEFQKEGVEFGIKRGCRILIADEMGVGKTIQALSLAYIYKDEWPLLIICPSCLRLTFKQEIIQWFKNYIYENEIQVISKKADKLLRSASIVIISYDMVHQLSEDIEVKSFQTCIIDEAHYLKSLDSLRSLHVVPIAQKMKNVILLTGTPALSRPKELFNILSILRPDVFKEFKPFGNRYCKPRVHQIFNQITYDGCDNEQELNFILQDRLMIRRSKEKILPDLPAKRRKKIIIEIAGSVKNKIKKVIGKAEEIILQQNIDKEIQQYQDFRTKITELNSNDNNNQGFSKTFNYVYQEIGIAKVECLKEYLLTFFETNSKFIVFAHHQQVLDAIEIMVNKDFKSASIRIDGNVNNEDRVIRVKQFQEDHKIKVAILSIQAASHGITLTASSHVIFAELYPVPAFMLQAEDRAHRINQKNDVLCHYLIAKDTIDERIFQLLQQKFQTTSKFIDGESAALEIHESQDFQCDKYDQQDIDDGKQQESKDNIKDLNQENEVSNNQKTYMEQSIGITGNSQQINTSENEHIGIQNNEKLPLDSKGNSQKINFNIFQAILADNDDDEEDSFEKGVEDSNVNQINENHNDDLKEGNKQAGIIDQLATLRQYISDDQSSQENTQGNQEKCQNKNRIVDLRKISDDSDSEDDEDWKEREIIEGQEDTKGKYRDEQIVNDGNLESDEVDIIAQLRQCRIQGEKNQTSRSQDKLEKQSTKDMDKLGQNDKKQDYCCYGGKEEQKQLGEREEQGNSRQIKERDKEKNEEKGIKEGKEDEDQQRFDEGEDGEDEEEKLIGEDCMIVISDVEDQEDEYEEDKNQDNNGGDEPSVSYKQIQITDIDNHNNNSNNTTHEESISFNEVMLKSTKSISEALMLIQSNEHSDSSDESDSDFCKEQLIKLSKNIKKIGNQAQITITKRSRQEFEEDSYVSSPAMDQIEGNQGEKENTKNQNTFLLTGNLKKIKKIR